MATKVVCGVPGCGRAYEAGRGGRGGEVPRCSMHLARDRRGSDRADVPGPVAGDGTRSHKLTVYVSETVADELEELRAPLTARSASEVASRLIVSGIEQHRRPMGKGRRR